MRLRVNTDADADPENEPINQMAEGANPVGEAEAKEQPAPEIEQDPW